MALAGKKGDALRNVIINPWRGQILLLWPKQTLKTKCHYYNTTHFVCLKVYASKEP